MVGHFNSLTESSVERVLEDLCLFVLQGCCGMNSKKMIQRIMSVISVVNTTKSDYKKKKKRIRNSACQQVTFSCYKTWNEPQTDFEFVVLKVEVKILFSTNIFLFSCIKYIVPANNFHSIITGFSFVTLLCRI